MIRGQDDTRGRIEREPVVRLATIGGRGRAHVALGVLAFDGEVFCSRRLTRGRHLRASQINGCSACVYSGAIGAKKTGESDERLFAVAAWRETELFDDAERAALALAESMTRLADRADAVPDDVWDEAARYFDEKQLAGLVLWVATTNLFNRLNATTRQVAGAAWSL